MCVCVRFCVCIEAPLLATQHLFSPSLSNKRCRHESLACCCASAAPRSFKQTSLHQIRKGVEKNWTVVCNSISHSALFLRSQLRCGSSAVMFSLVLLVFLPRLPVRCDISFILTVCLQPLWRFVLFCLFLL